VRALILAPYTPPELERLSRTADVVHESWLDSGRLHDPDELGARIAREDFSILVVEADFVFEEVFAAAPGLRLVAVCRNALNQVDLDAATQHGVAVTHAPGRNTNAVAELAVGLMFALARHIPQADRMVLGRGWRDPSAGYRAFRGREIAGATVGVVGFGQIGREVARKCLALGARVLAYDPLVPSRQLESLGVTPSALPQLAARCDFLTLHVPDAEATYRMIDRTILSEVSPRGYLINTGAGGAVDAEALVEALESGRLAGAALDVFEGQPLPLSSPLLRAPNLILTPHIGGATDESVERHSRMITEEIERFAAAKPLLHGVNDVSGVARVG